MRLFSKDDEQLRAEKAAADLREYWLARGYIVNTSVQYSGLDRHGRAIFTIATDMTNGLPTQRVERAR